MHTDEFRDLLSGDVDKKLSTYFSDSDSPLAIKVNVANKEIFNTLKEAISEYMNNMKWTDTQFGLR